MSSPLTATGEEGPEPQVEIRRSLTNSNSGHTYGSAPVDSTGVNLEYPTETVNSVNQENGTVGAPRQRKGTDRAPLLQGKIMMPKYR